MKALILSLVIAFSGSSALACDLDPNNFTSTEHTYTPRDKQQEHFRDGLPPVVESQNQAQVR